MLMTMSSGARRNYQTGTYQHDIAGELSRHPTTTHLERPLLRMLSSSTEQAWRLNAEIAHQLFPAIDGRTRVRLLGFVLGRLEAVEWLHQWLDTGTEQESTHAFFSAAGTPFLSCF